MFNQEDFRPGASPPSAPVAVDLRAVLELIPDAALMVDSHGRVAHSNSPARALFARVLQESFGLTPANWSSMENTRSKPTVER